MARTRQTPIQISNPYKAKARLSANQNIADATLVVITLDVEDFDTNSNFASNRYTAPVTGYYQVNFHTVIQTSGKAASFAAYVRKNGTTIATLQNVPYPAATTYGTVPLSYSELLYLTAGDYIDFAALSDTSDSSAATIVGAGEHTSASFYLVCNI